MEKNLTSGSVMKTVIYFSLPYLLSYFLQTLYGMADLFIIGQFGGVDGTTAVSVGSQVMHMLTVMIVGLAMGATVLIGRAVGAGDRKLAARGIGNTISLFAGLSILLTASADGGSRHYQAAVCPGGSGKRHRGISDDLLCRHPVHHRLQYHQLYFPRHGRLQKSDVFRCNRLYYQYCA